MKVVFVSSFYLVNNEPHKSNLENCLTYIKQLLDSKIYLYLYADPSLKEALRIFSHYKTLVIDTSITKESFLENLGIQSMHYDLPKNRSLDKDTPLYFFHQHHKPIFLEKAVSANSWKIKHYAWIDFDIFHLFSSCVKEKQETLYKISKIYYPKTIFLSPGFGDQPNVYENDYYKQEVFWRFCGNFFLGDRKTILYFASCMKENLINYVQQLQILPFEVNLMAFVEEHCVSWKPSIYKGLHYDPFQIPCSIVCSKKYPYKQWACIFPKIPLFQPSSASYLAKTKTSGLLNIRYVNYKIKNNGQYTFEGNIPIIQTKNVLCKVNFQENGVPYYENFLIVRESLGLEKHKEVSSCGLEDIRLYRKNGSIQFLATSLEYSSCGKSRMISGIYNESTRCFENGVEYVPPNKHSWCEKNWIPINESSHEEWFIYKWCPLQIGKIEKTDDGNSLVIQKEYDTKGVIWFEQLRGSSCFLECEEGYIGVVHFSEEGIIRHYYHCLVILEKESWKPLKITHPFVFFELGIEFCTGFCHVFQDYGFWVSRMDRNPHFVVKKKEDFSWHTI